MTEGVQDTNRYNNLIRNPEFSLPTIEEYIVNAIKNSYETLRQKQLNSINLQRKNLTSADVTKLTNDTYRISVNYGMIEGHAIKAYRLSSFFDSEITLQTINSNRNIFYKMPLLFINGTANFDYKIKCDGNITHFVFPVGHIIGTATEISIMFVENAGYTTVETNKYVVSKYNAVLPFKFFQDYLDDLNNVTNVAYFSSTGGVQSAGTKLIIDNGVNLNLTTEAADIINTSHTFTINVVGLKHIFDMENEYGVSTPFVIENYGKIFNMPIPVENILVFKKSGETYKLSNTAYAELHYPNIYVIKDSGAVVGDLYRISFFYDSTSTDEQYTNFLQSMLNLMVSRGSYGKTNIEEIIGALMNDPAPTGVNKVVRDFLTYKPDEIDYNHGDFFTTINPYHFDYKVNKFNSIFYKKEFAGLLSGYFDDVRTDIESYYLYTKYIKLSSRIRYDNSKEKNSLMKLVTFDEPCYVFGVRDDSGRDISNYRIYVDGKLYNIKYNSKYGAIQYIYVPVSMVTANSYIFIEIYDSFTYVNNTLVTGHSLTFSVENTSSMFIKTYDVCIKRNDTNAYVPSDYYHFKIDGVDYPTVTNGHDKETGMLLVGNIELIPTSQNLIPPETGLTVSIHKCGLYHVEDTNLSLISGTCKFVLPYTFHFTAANVRVFLGGLLADPSTYDIVLPVKEGDLTALTTKILLTNSHYVTFDVSPYRYSQIMYKAEITATDSDVYIDLKDVINKPFSLKYYDVFLNGRRLGYHNVIIITPTKIKLVNIKSYKHFYIFEKDSPVLSEIHPSTTAAIQTFNDQFLGSTDITDTDKRDIVSAIFKDVFPKDITVLPNENTEADITSGTVIDGENLDFVSIYSYWMTINSITKWNPDENQLDFTTLSTVYPTFTSYETDPKGNKVIKSYNGNMTGDILIRPAQISE